MEFLQKENGHFRVRSNKKILKARSNSSRPRRLRAPDDMNFDLQTKSQLSREFRARQSSFGRLCFRSLLRRAPIIRTILSFPGFFLSLVLSYVLFFLDLSLPSSLPSSSSSIWHFLFSCWQRTFAENAGQHTA